MQSTQKGHVTERQIQGDTIIGELLLLAGPTVVDSKTAWAARYNTWFLIKLTPKGVVFFFLFFSSKTATPQNGSAVTTTDPTTILSVSLDMRCKAQQVGPDLH